MEQLPEFSEASFSKGIWFVYNDEVNSLKMWVSCFTGKEKVYLNGECMSQKTNLKRRAVHKFEDAQGNNYEVISLVTSILKGVYECHFYKNGKLRKKYECRYKFGTLMNSKFLVLLLLGSVVLGVLAGLDYLSGFEIYIFIAIMILFRFRSSGSGIFSIEEVAI